MLKGKYEARELQTLEIHGNGRASAQINRYQHQNTQTVRSGISSRRAFLRLLPSAGVGLTAILANPVGSHSLADRFLAGAGLRELGLCEASSAPIEGALEIASSDQRLVDGLRRAKSQALKYVWNDDPVGPWYEAGLPGRNAFCMRDVSQMGTVAQ